jgi:hypothetical protein
MMGYGKDEEENSNSEGAEAHAAMGKRLREEGK